jgi:hypothetical protein
VTSAVSYDIGIKPTAPATRRALREKGWPN